MNIPVLTARLARTAAVLAFAGGIAVAGPGTAAASDQVPERNLVAEPTFAVPAELPDKGYPSLGVSPVRTLPRMHTSDLTAAPSAPTTVRAENVERVGGVGADLLGARPLGGSATGGSVRDIIPHSDDKRSAGNRA